MEKIILSLKNIYKILMTNDFPIYSESVIGERERKGQTVIRFWQNLLAAEFKSLPSGKMIWRYTEKRNRYTSQLCNRSLPSSVFQKYEKELAAQLSETSLLNQIDRFMQFLSGRLYKHEVLIRRTQELIRLCKTEDPYITDKIVSLLMKSAGDTGKAIRDVRFPLFQAGYLLSVMTLYAAAGDSMGEPAMEVLQQDSFSLHALWEMQRSQRTAISEKTTFWTNHAGTLQDCALPSKSFFGREEAVYDLLESILDRKKCLISGIGGIGKTELLRQLIRRCVEGNLVDTLAIVPYEGSLLASFARAFPGFQNKEPQESFHSICYQFQERAARGERVLLLIDDLHGEVEQDGELARLCDLPCGILITSRLDSLNGFETYHLTDPSITAGTLIFRDHYGQSLPQQDRCLLKELLQKEIICHPLTLKLMARAARSRGWSIAQLQSRLAEAGCSLSWTEGDRVVHLSEVYHQLYSFSHIPEDCRKLVELFTLLPHDAYTLAFLEKVFSEAIGDGDGLKTALKRLSSEGWLEKSESGYSMHPLIAQCLRRKTVTEYILQPYLPGIYRSLPADFLDGDWNERFNSKEYRTLNRILLSFTANLSGPVSPELFRNVCLSFYTVMPTAQEKAECFALLDRLREHCAAMNDELSTLYAMVCAFNERTLSELYLSLYERQSQHRTVPEELFYNFCCHAAICLRGEHKELCKQMLLEMIEGNVSPNIRTIAYYHMCILCSEENDFQGVLEWGEKGLDFAKKHPECGENMLFYMMVAPCNVYLAYQKLDKAEALLKEMSGMIRPDTLPSLLGEYYYLSALYERFKGNLEESLAKYKKWELILLEYYGKTAMYYNLLMETAITLSRMKRYQEAIEKYREVLAYYESLGVLSECVKARNNLASCYLDMGDAQTALDLLKEAKDHVNSMDPLLHGEIFRNLSRAYRILGNTEKEIPCLKESLPLLESVYGPEHERCTEMRERLAACERQLP